MARDTARTKLTLTIFLCRAVTGALQQSSGSYESELLRAGLQLSQDHSQQFSELYRDQFFKTEERRVWKKKGKARTKNRTKPRTKRAFWGLDKFFSDAIKAKNHFGGLKDRVGTYFGSDDTQV